MSDYPSLPSCFRPTATADIQSSPATLPASSSNPNLTTSLYHTDLGLFALTWYRNVIGRALHIDLHFDDDLPSLSSSSYSFRLQIKPFLFWRKHGSKKFNLNNTTRKVEIYWDLTNAKFVPGPGPQSGFYVAVVVDGEMALLVGDSHNDAYTRTKARKPERTQVLVLRREHVFGNKLYTTKATLGGKTRDISIDCSVGHEPKLCFSIDGKRVLQIKRLKWKFRGNERIQVDGVPIQVSWDVYNWLFEDVDDGHAVFMFRFEKMGVEEEDEANENNGMVLWPQQSFGFGMNGFERKKVKKNLLKTRSSSSSSMSSASSGCSSSVMEWASREENELQCPSGFSLLVYAWKS
ncbi:hypothetical protein HHK36_013850 [Tetracentron sinense]|uniref:DUF868 domain-containing protein n=1 Tax=Tetracentron sinense TaxID=13715 RepID=A0A834ZB75_TETSI|nr:hypothetical protein HHK36_013850 [Tetracentron sinense]